MRRVSFLAFATLTACLCSVSPAQSAPATDGRFHSSGAVPVELSEAAVFEDSRTQPPQTPSYPASTPSQSPAPGAPAPTAAQTPGTSVAPPSASVQPFASMSAYDPDMERGLPDRMGSVYIPVDSWVYPEMVRLYELGYVDSIYLGLRPWTRRSVLHALEDSQLEITRGDSEEANGILAALLDEVRDEAISPGHPRGTVYGMQSAYTRLMGIGGTPLRDSFHLGQTIANDYGRPYEHGFNAIAGFSTVTEAGRFSLFFRGEYQHAPSAAGYPLALANEISELDQIGPYVAPNAPQATIPGGPIAAQNPFRIVEATLSYHVLGHEISGGKSDAWLGPAAGASMAWSNNAEDIYSFRINRVEPLHIPLLSSVLGPFRYDFFYGSLKGHTYPNSPYVHSEAVSFVPSRNLQIGFQRTIIFGGQGHAPVNLHLFLKGFFGLSNVSVGEKLSRDDPGARFSSFNLTYRLPYLRHSATFYVDSTVHDDVSPIDAPRRAGYRTGIDISQMPGLPKLELRVEAASTDPGISRSDEGAFLYVETVQKQGYTNKGFLLADWIGREAKGGQAWATYHLAAGEWVQFEYLNKKNAKDFVGGTTQNQFKVTVVKRFKRDFEVNGWAQYERWKAPIFLAGPQHDTTGAVQVTWFPRLKRSEVLK